MWINSYSLVMASKNMEFFIDSMLRNRELMLFLWIRTIWCLLKYQSLLMDGVELPFLSFVTFLKIWFRIMSTLMAFWSTTNNIPVSRFTFLLEITSFISNLILLFRLKVFQLRSIWLSTLLMLHLWKWFLRNKIWRW